MKAGEAQDNGLGQQEVNKGDATPPEGFRTYWLNKLHR
jgi:hypothetical protein